ncbi:MAG: glycerol-3-phosphate 1-O-acyltransferase PlsY [Planctomycetes bacterium]|nr:glycerol-3-phosphate 1-O-acyltransferase PlsY [Planctomycetota bacterium]
MIYYIICAVTGYLIGSIPFGYILVKLIKGIDIRTVGSGNIGATNVARVLGLPWGILCFLLDTAKGFLTAWYIFDLVLLLQHYFVGDSYNNFGHDIIISCVGPTIPIGLTVIIGHLFPVYIRFRGGKGVATGLGVFLALMPKSTLIALGIWLVFLLTLRYVSLASIMAAIALAISCYYEIYMFSQYGIYMFSQTVFTIKYEEWWKCEVISLISISLVSLLIILKHIPNIKRLIVGTEPKVRLWGKKSST